MLQTNRRDQNEKTDELMACLRIKANECSKNTRLKEQILNDKKDKDIMTEVIRELIVIKKLNEVTSEQVLPLARIGELQRA